jgi:hypothetical protein
VKFQHRLRLDSDGGLFFLKKKGELKSRKLSQVLMNFRIREKGAADRKYLKISRDIALHMATDESNLSRSISYFEEHTLNVHSIFLGQIALFG